MCMGAKTVQNWMMIFLFRPILQVLPDPVMSIKKVREITFQNLQFYQTLRDKISRILRILKKSIQNLVNLIFCVVLLCYMMRH